MIHADTSRKLSVDIVHRGGDRNDDRNFCVIDEDIEFNPEGFSSYFVGDWNPIIYDAMVLSAAVEFCDRSLIRTTTNWSRAFKVTIPVHEPRIWNSSAVSERLIEALECLTGDSWKFNFVETKFRQDELQQATFKFDNEIEAVLPFSDGVDSLAAGRIFSTSLGNKLIRVRVGGRKRDREIGIDSSQAFAAVPFKVKYDKNAALESSFRSRGFKFSMICGLAAYLSKASTVIVPESGQGALGPMLVKSSVQSRSDLRTHPEFTMKMAAFLNELLDSDIKFDHPFIWQTKGQTVAHYVQDWPNDQCWRHSRSCWRGNNLCSVGKKHRQCGICAACLLRRLSFHAAKLDDDPESYAWHDLNRTLFWDAAHPDLKTRHKVMEQYAVAAIQHMDQLANLAESAVGRRTIERQALILSRSFDVPFLISLRKTNKFLHRHRYEWRDFLGSLAPESFVRNLAVGYD